MHERCTGMNAAASPIVSIHQFKITLPTNIEFDISLHADGQLVDSVLIQAGENDEILGAYKSAHSILPFKFREMRTIELKVYGCRMRGITKPSTRFVNEDYHRGRVSGHSKKTGRHHIAYVIHPFNLVVFPLVTTVVATYRPFQLGR